MYIHLISYSTWTDYSFHYFTHPSIESKENFKKDVKSAFDLSVKELLDSTIYIDIHDILDLITPKLLELGYSRMRPHSTVVINKNKPKHNIKTSIASHIFLSEENVKIVDEHNKNLCK